MPRKCSWSHLDPKVRNEHFKVIFDEGFGRVPKSDFLVTGTPPAPKPSAGAAEPSHEAAQPSADPARPSSETAKPRPAHGDNFFLSKPRPDPASPIYGDSAALSKPGAKHTKPSIETTKPSADIAKPSRASRARGGSQERSWCCAGLRGFDAKTSRGSFGHRGGQSQNCEAQAIWPISLNKNSFQHSVLCLGFEKMGANPRR